MDILKIPHLVLYLHHERTADIDLELDNGFD